MSQPITVAAPPAAEYDMRAMPPGAVGVVTRYSLNYRGGQVAVCDGTRVRFYRDGLQAGSMSLAGLVPSDVAYARPLRPGEEVVFRAH